MFYPFTPPSAGYGAQLLTNSRPTGEEQIMLTLTDNAVTAIRALISQPEQPPDAGLRIMGQGEGVPPFELALAETPADGDQVIEANGARVFLASDAAEVLADKALDAEVDAQGGVAFSVSSQPA
jgi:iron-sulfur cluster assembly protein